MTSLDYALVAILLLLLPAHALWRSLRTASIPVRSRSSRYLRSTVTAALLAALLVTIWSIERRSWALLGLELPASNVGLIGLIASGSILLLLAGTILLKRPDESSSLSPGADKLPQTRQETALFLLLTLVIGFGWELLYRGYLLWALTPLIGTAAAVAVAATAYGLAHGFSDPKSLLGAMIASFLFTIAYVLTGSLWWLILVHMGLPLMGLLAARFSRPYRT